MSRTSEYTLELQIQDDKSKDALRELEKGLKNVGETVKRDVSGDDLTKNLEASQAAAQSIINRFHEMASDSDLNFQAIAKAYSKNAGNAIAELEKQYAVVKDQLDASQKMHDENVEALRSYNKLLENQDLSLKERYAIYDKISFLEKEQRASNLEQLKAQVQQNRQIRANLKAANQSAMMERANAKYKKLEELYAKRKAATDKSEKKSLDEKIKQQKAYIKSIEQAEKITKKTTEQTGKLEKAWEFVLKHANRIGKVTQYAYNITGMASGAARTAKSVVGAGIGIAKQIGAGISEVSKGANEEVERERQANRIKGYDNPDERVDILRQIYVRTGADYSTIVDAIGRVQSILGKSLSKNELISAVAIELRYPGMSQAFASSTSKADPAQFQRYANRMKAMQHATGASDEQIQESTQVMANMKPGDFGSASITELQTVYLGLQNSGAFDSQEELDKAFRTFVRKQRDSSQNVFEAAQNYNWVGHISGERNRLQAQNTLQQMNWSEIGSALNKPEENTTPEMSKAETMAMKMREIEDKKNQLLMKLIPAVLPVVEGIAHLMDSKGESIVKGLMALFETVIPLLDPVFRALDAFLGFMSQTILPGFQKLINVVVDWFGDEDNQNNNAIPQNAAGGLAFMPSIVGERGPEAIIPLDYSRAQRAENIANTVNQTFNMGGNQTTALSLAQAVRSRDFTRAMTDNQFFTRRCGAF